MTGSSLRDVARLRSAATEHAIADGSTVKLSEVQIQSHGTCDVHGHVNETMAFYLDFNPEGDDVSATTPPGMLQLVARCSTN